LKEYIFEFFDDKVVSIMRVKHIFTKTAVLLTFLLTLVACVGSILIINDEAKMLTDERFFMGFSPWTWGLVSAGALTLCAAFLLWLHYSKRLSPKGLTIFSAALFAVCALLYVITVCNFQSIPTTDSYIVQDQALVLAKNPDSTIDTSITYFARYANNNLLILLLSGFFRIISVFGVSNYYLASIILNAFCLFISEVLIYLAVKKLFGTRFACSVLFISVLSPVMYLTAPWVYSVSLCMPFIAALLYLGACLLKEKRYPFLAVEAILFAAVTVLGYFIRPIVVIFAFAFFICFLIWLSKTHKKLIKSLLITVCCVCVSVPAFFCVNGVISSYYQDDSGNFPITHWIMMGLHTNGSVNAEDQRFTAQFATKEEKTKANLEEIKKTLREYGVPGLAVHFAKKHCLTWSEGSADYTARVKQNAAYTPLYDYVAGDRNDFLLLYCQAFRLALFLLVLVSLARQFFSKRRSPLFFFVLSLFGGMLFYLLWEAKQSYSIPFLFLLTVLSVHGLETADKLILDKWRQKKTTYKKVAFYSLSAAVLITTLSFGIARYGSFTQTTAEYRDISIMCCNTSNIKQIKNLAKLDSTLTQTFFTDKAFNTVELHTAKLDGDASYQITLLNSRPEVLLQSIVSETDVGKGGILKLSVPETKQKFGEKYTLEIKRVDEKTDSIGWKYCFSRESDMYRGLLSAGAKVKPFDLMLNVYSLQNKVYMPPAIYIGIFLGILIFEFLIILLLKKIYL